MEINIKDGYKVTEVGVIPNNWEVKMLVELGYSGRPAIKAGPFGSSLKKEFYVEKGYKIYGQEQVIAGDLAIGNYYIDSYLFEKLKSCEIRPNDILISLVGTFGKVIVVPDNIERGIINPRLLRLSLNTNLVYSYFLQYWLISSTTQKLLSETSHGGTMGIINAKVLSVLSIPLPPLAEQKAIAHALSDVDNLITAIDQLITKKRNLKQGTMQELLTGKKRLPGFSGKWEVKTFRECFDFLSTGNNSRSDLSEYGNVGYIHYGDIHTQWNLVLDCDKDNIPLINKEKVKGLPTLKDGDLIIADASEDYEGLGVSIEIKNIQDKEIVAGLHTLLLRADKQVIADGFKAFITSMQYVKQSFQKIATGISVYGISKTNLKNVEILLPPTIEEQKAISEILTDIDKEIEALEKKRDKYKAIKQGMMQELLTGKTRIIDN